MRRLAAALLALALVGPATAQTPARKTEDALQAERRKLQQTEQQLREERRKAAEARARESSLLAELEKIEQGLLAKQQEITRLDRRIRRTQGEVTGLRSEIRNLEDQRSGQEDALSRRLRAMYRMHVEGGALPVLLGGDDPVARAVALRHLTRLAALDARMIQ